MGPCRTFKIRFTNWNLLLLHWIGGFRPKLVEQIQLNSNSSARTRSLHGGVRGGSEASQKSGDPAAACEVQNPPLKRRSTPRNTRSTKKQSKHSIRALVRNGSTKKKRSPRGGTRRPDPRGTKANPKNGRPTRRATKQNGTKQNGAKTIYYYLLLITTRIYNY